MNDTPVHRTSLDAPPVPNPTLPPTTSWEPQPHAEPPTSRGVRNVVKELLETAIFILLVFFIVRGMIQNFKIEGSSMEPTMHSNQYILANKLIYFHFDLNAPLRMLPGNESLPQRTVYPFRPPQRGDIVVFEYPRDVRKDYIKRVIGVPGDVIEFRDGGVFVNQRRLDEPYLQGIPTYCNPGAECSRGPVVVPEGTVFVMGDNRTNSSDSREWNALPLDRVIGQAWVLYYPVSDWGVVQHHTYAATP